MEKRKIILVLAGALVGAVGGVLLVSPGIHISDRIAALATDEALLAHRQLLIAAVAGWAFFGVYWEIAARGAAPAKSSESGASRGVHVFLANAALLLEIAPIHGLGRALPISIPLMSAGLGIEALGLFLTIWARRHLGKNWSGEITIKVDHQLIRTGPYTRLRHPIYTGLLAMYAGVALVTGEWLAMLGLAIAAFAYWRKIRLEEANLNVAFGPDYDAYRRETWALVPGLF